MLASLCSTLALLVGGCESTDPVTETDLGTIELSVEEAEVEMGDTLSLRAERRHSGGTVSSLDAEDLSWESSDPDVASVDAGTVTAHDVGEVRITASGRSGNSSNTNVRVRTRPASFEAVSDEPEEAVVGETLPDSVVVRLLGENDEPASGFALRFSVVEGDGSASPGVTQTDDDGLARTEWTLGPEAGEQTLEVNRTNRQGPSKTLSVTASPDAPAVMNAVDGASSGSSGELLDPPPTVKVTDSHGNPVPEVSVRWTVADDESGTVEPETSETDENGIAETAWTLGPPSESQTLVAEIEEGSEGVRAEFVVEASTPSDASMSLTPSSLDLEPGEDADVTATIENEEGDEVVDPDLSWSSSDDAVVEVEGTGHEAVVTAVDPGTAEVVANSDGVTASLEATVESSSPEVDAVEVSPSSAELREGDTKRFTATVRDEDGEEMADEEVVWATSDESVATVDADGREAAVTAVAEGEAEISVQAQEEEASAPVIVDPADDDPTVESVEVSPSALELETGESDDLTATLLDQHGDEMEDVDVSWSSSDASVATVEGDGLTALVTAESEGSTTVTAEAEGHSDEAAIEVSLPPPPPSGEIPAFPEAEGWGATALNECRDLPLEVHEVTNTDDSGPGSFRDAVENQTNSSTYDIIIFRTGGTIESRSQILLRRDCVYIAGQTAPGDGILIRSHPTDGHNGHLLRVNQREDVVIRYLRLRHGEEGGYGGGGVGLIGGGGARNIIFDQISASWGGRNAHLQFQRNDGSRETLRLTMQNNLVAEGFQNRGVMLYGGGVPSAYGFRNVSYHRNATAAIGHRHPRIHGGDAAVSTDEGVEVINNVMFAAGNRVSEARGASVVDWIKNYVDHGPHQDWRESTWRPRDGHAHDPLDPSDPGSLSVEGNTVLGFSDPHFETWREHGDRDQTLPEEFERSTRLSSPLFPVQEMTPEAARDWIIDNAGASQRVSCRGDWVSARDEVDTRIADYIQSRDPSDVPDRPHGEDVEAIHGGWPIMDQGSACEDSDGDGLPDQWEDRYFDCPGCANPSDMTESGYLVIEHYLNGTDPR